MHKIIEVVDMRIAVPTNGGGREDTVAPVFARAPAFYIADVDENGNIVGEKVIQNSAAMVGRGTGPMVMQTLINEGVEAIIAPLGPKAFGLIRAAGIKLYQVAPGTLVEEAIKSVVRNRAGQFTEPAPQAPVAPVTPVTPATPATPVYPAYPAYGFGYGWGRGLGRGRCFGRGRGWGARLGYCPWWGLPNRRNWFAGFLGRW